MSVLYMYLDIKGAFWRTRSVQQKWVWQNASLLGVPITN